MLALPDKAVVACLHLLPTPGSPGYAGKVSDIYDQALAEVEIFSRHRVDAVIVENFRDGPFYPGRVPAETLATVAGVTREVVRAVDVPVGVAVLRNDATGALAIATATGADFIRVNVHVGAVLSAQGVVTGNSHDSLRLRRNLGSDVAILADARVKHSEPFAYPDLATEIRDLTPHTEGVIVSGELTGLETTPDDLVIARRATTRPVLVGSGVTESNLDTIFDLADGFVVGSAFKHEGKAGNLVDEHRVAALMGRFNQLRAARSGVRE
jgi:uncharacterized protein